MVSVLNYQRLLHRGGGSCNLTEIPAILSNLTSVFSDSTLQGLGNNIKSLGTLSTTLAIVLGGLKNGTIDPDALKSITDALNGLELPDTAALATSFNALADALENANPCLSILGTKVTPTVQALRAVAHDFQASDTAMQSLKSALADLKNAKTAEQYLNALSAVSKAIADGSQSIVDLKSSRSNLSDALSSLSIPSVGNLGILGDIMGTLSPILHTVASPLSNIIAPLQQASTTLGQLANLAKAIENKDTDAIIDALDVLGNTHFFNNAQTTTLSTLSAINDLSNTINALVSAPIPTMGSLTCTNAQSYQSDMIAYLDGQITLYTTLQANITTLDTIVNINGNKINTNITTIINQLTNTKNEIDGFDVQSACNDANQTAEQIQAKLTELQNKFDTAKANLDTILQQAQHTIDQIKDEIKSSITDIKSHINSIISGVESAVDTILDMIPGISNQVKNQIKNYVANFKDMLSNEIDNFLKDTHQYLINNKISAPVANNLTCLAELVSTTHTTTFSFNAHPKANKVWGYVAKVTNTSGVESLYILPGGTLADLSIDTPDYGDYTVELRAIGKSVTAVQPILDFLKTLDLTNSELAQITDLTKIQAQLNLFNASVGSWTKINETGDFKASDVLKILKDIDTLVDKYKSQTSLKAKAIQSLFNDTVSYTAIVTSMPQAQDVSIVTLNGADININLSGTDANNDTLTYTSTGYGSSNTGNPPSLSGVVAKNYTTNTTDTYTVSKTVGTCNHVLSTTANINVTVIEKPAVSNITINGIRGTNFSYPLTGTNLTGTLSYSLSGTIGTISGTTYAGILPTSAGTYTTTYKVCVNVMENTFCSDNATITFMVTNPASSGGGGGGGYSAPSTPTTGTEVILSGNTEELLGNTKCSIKGSQYSAEQNSGYLYACSYDITTMRTIQTARVEDHLTRAEFAKMISNYAKNILKKTPNTDKVCKFNDLDEVNAELAGYAITSCQYDIMGINMTADLFLPNKTITRAEVATILSRLYDLSSDSTPYYKNHMAAMKAKGFITVDNPHMTEVRGYVFIMLERIAKEFLTDKGATK